MLTILICKLAIFAGRLLGRGSSLPGAIARKLDPNILGRLTLPGLVIAVTGSNGKTSTTELIRAAAEATGKRVICNSEGSNQIEGITTLLLRHCNLRGVVQADIAILESDERFCQYTFSYFAPDYMVLCNLFRDQTTRNGSAEFVAGELKKGMPEQSVFIVNADDPAVSALAHGRDNTIFFGVAAAELREAPDMPHAFDDGACCPLCFAPMRYDYRVTSHVGCYHCTGCDFARIAPRHAVTGMLDGAFVLDGSESVVPQLCNTSFAYNIAAAYSVAVECLGLTPQQAAQALSNHTLSNGLINRVERFTLGGHDGLFLLSKHENAMAYNGSIATILQQPGEGRTVAMIVDLLSRKYIANDMSWLWDIDFEQLCDERVARVVCGGLFAHDVAARLLMAGVPEDRLAVFSDLDGMMDDLRQNAEGDIYLMTCFTDIPKFQRRLRQGGAA